MPQKKKTEGISLNWEDFIKLGDPANAPEETVDDLDRDISYLDSPLKVHYERKGRGGKEAIIIKDHAGSDEIQQELAKIIKSKLGVGGNAKDGEIVIQGNQRDKVMDILKDLGYKKAKKAGG